MTGLAQINAPLGGLPPRPNRPLRQFEMAVAADNLQTEPPLQKASECVACARGTESGPDLATQIKGALESLDTQAQVIREQLQEELVDWLRALFGAAAPMLTRACTDAVIAQLLSRGNGQSVEIKAHPSVYDTIERNLPRSGGVSVVKDDTLDACAVCASWQDGGMFADPAAAAAEIISLLEEKLSCQKAMGK